MRIDEAMEAVALARTAQAVAAEREACAELVIERQRQYWDHFFSDEHVVDAQCVECERLYDHAAAIRARGGAVCSRPI